MLKSVSMDEQYKNEIKLSRIVWLTTSNYMICRQDNTGNLFYVAASAPTYPNDSQKGLFDERINRLWYMPLIPGNTNLYSDPDDYHSSEISIGTIPPERVFKSVIKRIVKPIDGNTSYIDGYNLAKQRVPILSTQYYPSSFSCRLRPRIPLTATNYSALITSWDSSDTINQTLFDKLDKISGVDELNPNIEYEGLIIPKSYNLPVTSQSAPGTPDSNYPYVIINTRSIIEIDYYWR